MSASEMAFSFRRDRRSGRGGGRGLAMGGVIAAAICAIAMAGCSVNTSLSGNFTGYHSDVGSVQVVSAVVGGKNVFIPSTIVVTDDRPQTLMLFNTTDAPHGFAIEGLGIEAVLPVGEEYAIALPPLVGGNVYRIHCQLHPPHRSATLVVLEGEAPH